MTPINTRPLLSLSTLLGGTKKTWNISGIIIKQLLSLCSYLLSFYLSRRGLSRSLYDADRTQKEPEWSGAFLPRRDAGDDLLRKNPNKLFLRRHRGQEVLGNDNIGGVISSSLVE
mmetsp:Transcript_3965/g.8987  ORF Transcript_3965/g.8987 Transcript_3965/m.8987 type:complete len:115 (+) Transcript_3965:1130-1474(+)